MKKIYCLMALMAMMVIILPSCSDDDPIKKVSVKVEIECPEKLGVIEIEDIHYTFTEVSTGGIIEYSPTEETPNLVLNAGLYHISAEATGYTEINDVKTKNLLRAEKKNVEIVEDFQVQLDAYISSVADGFVLEELFFSHNLNAEGRMILNDSYFRIRNNSDRTLYADGLFLAESEFQFDMKNDYRPDLRSKAAAVGYVTCVPGNGTEHPVEPGETILLVDAAINFENLGWDFTKADFEWYDEHENPNVQDTDNENVINLIRVFTYSKTIWAPHTRGVKAYMIGKLECPIEVYKNEYKYHYEWDFVFNDVIYPMGGDAMFIPNAWISDAVNIAVKDKMEWNVISPSLDRGYSWFSEVDHDNNRYGKSVRRKYDPATKKLIDTNDSTNDFEPAVKAEPFFKY